MSWFSRKKNKEESVPKVEVDKKSASVKSSDVKSQTAKSPVAKSQAAKAPVVRPAPVSSEALNVLEIVKSPRVSEKAAIVAESSNAYIFNVAKNTTKTQIKSAIQKVYKVTPIKVTIAQVPDKRVQIRGQRGKTGVKSGGKKAFVFLKKGDKIEFI
ncbi:MAG TPA: 50S ribosomal protein L23 [Candidatus Paceibacterota bacterium]|nr:50S ribosomal protein L23 [Candidatus Paceibacterota bacterium]HRZ34289.1 50S ribosomal protein L23 [Candidatus Paceibacterota bacterium]